MSRGPRYKNRSKPTGFDTPENCLRRLGEMAEDPVRWERIRICVDKIYELASNAGTEQQATRGGQTTNSVSMKIRHFHNELDYLVGRHCLGALYRSEGVVDLATSGGLQCHLLHQEHTIPTNVLAGMVFNAVSSSKNDTPDIRAPQDLCAFLLTQSVVTAVTRDEARNFLSKKSSVDGRGGPAWHHTHPNFRRTDRPNRFGARPFLRYHGTGLAVTFWPTGEKINLETDTLANHIRRIEQLPLYNWRTFFKDAPMAA